jgi:hypothetical protein
MALNLLFLTRSFPPHHTARAIQIARLAAHLDHQIHVVCCGEDWREDHSIAPRIEARLSGLVRVPYTDDGVLARLERGVQNRFRMPDPYRRWALRAAKTIAERDLLVDCDALITFGEPMSDHLAGLALKAEHPRLPWLAHFSDPWADNPFRPQNLLSRFINRRFERRVIEAADALIFTSRETIELGLANYPPGWRAKAHVVPHAFDPALYPKVVPASGRFTLRHLGNFYGARSPRSLFRALALLGEQEPSLLSELAVELFGRGTEEAARLPELAPLPKGLVALHPPVSYTESLALMKGADLLLVIDAPAAKSVFLPSKLIDYVGAGRPILGITPPGAAAELIESLGGRVAAPDDAPAVARALSGCLRALRSKPSAEPWGDWRVRARYEAGAVAAAMARIIEATVAASTSADARTAASREAAPSFGKTAVRG